MFMRLVYGYRIDVSWKIAFTLPFKSATLTALDTKRTNSEFATQRLHRVFHDFRA